MGCKTFKQYDSRWGSKNYNGSSTMAQAGCGPTAVADIAYEVNDKVTPWKVAKFMQEHGYAVYGNGTAWAGIPAAMKHFGLEDVQNVATMPEVFKLLKKGYSAVFLMRAGTKGGITWTTAGHFIAVTSIKEENGKHYLWTRDPGGRDHDGWYCYETQMMGLIPQVWMGKAPNSKPITTKKSVRKGVDVSAYQSNINWKKVKKDGYDFAIIRAGYGAGNVDKRFKEHMKGAIEAGLDVGVYWFSYAYTKPMARKEADFCIELAKNYKLTLPVYFDFEGDSLRYARENGKNLSKADITGMTLAFCKRIEKTDGLKAGCYYNYDYKKNHYNMDELKNYSHWYALYSDEKADCDIQQYSSSGKVDGISGSVDVNKMYVDVTKEEKEEPAEEKEEKPTKLGLIHAKAVELAWAYGTKKAKYSYPNGRAKKAFEKAIKEVYPERKKWSKQPSVGASCDVFVGTVIRASGVDKKFPRGLDEVIPYVNKSKKWKKLNIHSKSKMKKGDVIYQIFDSGNGHISIYVGDGKIANAHYYGKTYGIIQKYENHVRKNSECKEFYVLRPR